MILIWILVFVVGLAAAALASRRAVTEALRAADSSATSAGFIGLTVMAIGTDLPEIANSVISAATGHGDLNVGDSAGSALTQITLVLGILCFVTQLTFERRLVVVLGTLTALALLFISVLISDEFFGRWDGLVLIAAWIIALVGVRPLTRARSTSDTGDNRIGQHVLLAGSWLVVVAIAATVVVQSFVKITESFDVPEIVAGAVVLALGTSLPELIVDWTAVRRGATMLALGDLFGSSLLDATLAIGIGPAITPTAVSSAAATTCLIAAGAVACTTVVVARRTELTHATGFALVGIYIAASIALITYTG